MARPIAKDHDAKRQHILKRAAGVFAAEGVARATMAQVAQACGISKANIYHYYDSKDALLFDILDTYLSALRDRIAGLSLSGLAPEAQLHLIIQETLLAYDGMDAEHQIQIEAIPLLPTTQQAVLKDYQRQLVAEMSAVLGTVAPNAFADDPARLRSATMAVFGMLNWFYVWNSDADRSARLSYARMVTDMTVKGVTGL